MNRVVMFSGGIGSWATALRVAERHGTAGMVLLFADTLIEDEDLYRFLNDAGAQIGVPVTKLSEGRDVWQVFHDAKFLGNTRVDPCSRILKRELLRRHIDASYDPAETVIYLGIGWDEQHRFTRAARHWSPWKSEAPMCDPPYLDRRDVLALAEAHGLRLPRLYEMGFAHNNCGGFCVKSGQAQFALLLRMMPARYAYHERREQELRDYLGKDVAIMRDRTGGQSRPLTLREFRETIEQQGTFDQLDWGGCACFEAPE